MFCIIKKAVKRPEVQAVLVIILMLIVAWAAYHSINTLILLIGGGVGSCIGYSRYMQYKETKQSVKEAADAIMKIKEESAAIPTKTAETTASMSDEQKLDAAKKLLGD